ncbi:MAG TPA: patatin-like phospholipase family protein [Acidimicrobiales bacterium]|nr:patatin-like phospholipase family protein [Acidimicrobiales bacterium]
MKTALVLGGGGTVGLAYHAGVLRALEVEGGFAPDDAEVIIGTSAGSVIAAYLRSGMTTRDMWLLALGQHPDYDAFGGSPERRPDLFVPTWKNPLDISRHLIGSAYVMARAVSPFPLQPPRLLKALFPGGLFTLEEGRRRFAEELPGEWPEKALWLTTVDIVTGRRVVLGRAGAPPVDLPRAVLASAAIPGLYQPVQVGRRSLIDGGAHSTSNLDLGVQAGVERIIGVVPLAFDTGTPPGRLGQLVRRIPARQLSAEMELARRRGIEVLLFRPSASEVRNHGFNMMRPNGLEQIAELAYEATVKTLTTERFANAFASVA